MRNVVQLSLAKEFGCKFGVNETMFSPSCDRSCVKKKADQFASRRYSLKPNFGK